MKAKNEHFARRDIFSRERILSRALYLWSRPEKVNVKKWTFSPEGKDHLTLTTKLDFIHITRQYGRFYLPPPNKPLDDLDSVGRQQRLGDKLALPIATRRGRPLVPAALCNCSWLPRPETGWATSGAVVGSFWYLLSSLVFRLIWHANQAL
jgi:hypothetical protein